MALDDGTTDVVVVGAGPVGIALAILLGQQGHRVEVLERWPAPYRLPRAVHFDGEVGRLLQACGLGDVLADLSEPADVYEWRNGAGRPLLRFGRTGTGASGWPQSSMFNQPALELALETRAASLPSVMIRRGVEVGAVEPQVDGTVLVRGKVADGDDLAVRGRYVVGCDGAGSTVRRLLDVPVHDLGFFHDWLIVDVVLDEPRVFDPINLQICDPVRPVTAVSGGPGRRRWEFMRLPHERIEDLDDEAVAWGFLADWDVHPGNARLERHAVYTFQARWVEEWRVGSVLLAGDAAHQMPPFAGQGLCSGLRDAANVAWKLDLVLRDLAGAALLDAYQVERMPNVRAVIDFSMALGKVICVPDAEEAAARDEAMGAGVVGDEVSEVPDLPGITEGVLHPDDPAAGSLFPQGTVTVAGATGRFDDLLGAGWRLVTIAPVEVDPDLLAWFSSLGGAVVALGTDALDHDGTYTAWFARHDATAALQRPDFHLYGAGADPAELLRSLRAHL